MDNVAEIFEKEKPQSMKSGDRFGRLTVLAEAPPDSHRARQYECRCDCGNKKTVAASRLRQGTVRSCGCLARETNQQLGRIIGLAKTNHGECAGRRQGKKVSAEYNIWVLMIQRCYTPTNNVYHYYGGRGIQVCDRWRESFSAFLDDMGRKPSPRHSLDRKDNSLGYSPENCRWATRIEQGRNRRNNRLITINGETRTLSEWAELSGVDRSTIGRRLNHGWPSERLLEAARPIKKLKRETNE